MQEGWSEFAQHASKVSEFKTLEHLSESDTRAFLIDPVLRLLGYEHVGDIRREVPVKETKEFLDYELRAKGQPCAIVEAKSLRNSVTDSASAQCVQYAAINGVRWCVITNGVVWAVFDAYAKGPLAQKQVDTVTLDGDSTSVARAWSVLSLMSKSNMEAGGGFTPLLIERVLRDELTRADSAAISALRKVLKDRLQESLSAPAVAQRVQKLMNWEPVPTGTTMVSDAADVVPLLPTPAVSPTRRVRVSALVKAQLLKPGDTLLGSSNGASATVRDDGRLDCNGYIAVNLWDAASAFGVTINSQEIWNFWSAPDGRPMSAVKADFVALSQ